MSVDPTAMSRQRAGADRSEHERASFPNGSVVQVVGGDARLADAIVIDVHPARVTVTDRRIIAIDGDVEWSWYAEDLELVVHGRHEAWSILVVRDISDFGVAVPLADADAFRRAVGELPHVMVVAQAPLARQALFDPGTVVDAPSAPAPLPRGPVPTLTDVPVAPAPTADVTSRMPLVPPAAPTAPTGGVLPPSVSTDAPLLILGEPTVVVERRLVAKPGPPAGPPRLAGSSASGGVPGTSGDERKRFGLRGRQPASSMADLSHLDALAGIDARNISAWFGNHQVLDRVSLNMEAGKVTALIGPSGCGKSTFLRILNRMHEMIPGAQMGGEVLLDGHDIYDPERKLTDARREVGMVFQKPNPFPAMSIYDNVLASFRLTGMKATTALKDEIVEACLAKAGLWNEVKDRLRQPGGGLSGGQQQRLCIARALAIRPRVLLMDEPCSALDPTSTRRIEETIMQIVSEVTIVIVTHNMQQAARVSEPLRLLPGGAGHARGDRRTRGDRRDVQRRRRTRGRYDYVNGRFG